MRFMAFIVVVAALMVWLGLGDAWGAAVFALLALTMIAFTQAQALMLRHRHRELAEAVQGYEAGIAKALD